MPDQETTALMWSTLIELGVYVNMSRPPATPAGVFLLRCSICALHSDEQIDIVLGKFEQAAQMAQLALHEHA
jgi:7-keto-8-aminopelargonate synthetase-like enzyme